MGIDDDKLLGVLENVEKVEAGVPAVRTLDWPEVEKLGLIDLWSKPTLTDAGRDQLAEMRKRLTAPT